MPKESFNFVEGSTTDLPFADESFDFVASNGVIMHLKTTDDAVTALSELSRVTKKVEVFTYILELITQELWTGL
jgi:ubiquinone/menaquinone biosynthesis C-methylase UbiE